MVMTTDSCQLTAVHTFLFSHSPLQREDSPQEDNGVTLVLVQWHQAIDGKVHGSALIQTDQTSSNIRHSLPLVSRIRTRGAEARGQQDRQVWAAKKWLISSHSRPRSSECEGNQHADAKGQLRENSLAPEACPQQTRYRASGS